MATHAVALLSGGLDSATATAMTLGEGVELEALTINYGQRHASEIDAAKRVAASLAVAHVVADLPHLASLFDHSALTDADREVPQGRSDAEIGEGVPITYVPLRNAVFGSIAAARLESNILTALESGRIVDRGIIVVGANAVDYSGYPDCRPEFYGPLEAALREGSTLQSVHGIEFAISMPVIEMTKAEIARTAQALGVPINATRSCYLASEDPCGECDSCLIRDAALREIGL